ncbi:50S ribosomal protein L25 [bacterium]|nr:50S ribosomal protein L25 [bacterium]
MANVELKAELREEKGSGSVKRLRASGWIPGIIYGNNKDNINVKVNNRDIIHLLHSLTSEHPLIKINVKNKKSDVLIKSIQYHPYRNEILHLDFHQVAMDELLTTSVIIEAAGESKGVLAGGVLEHTVRELQIQCLPSDIPSLIEVDVTELEIGGSVYISDITPPKGVIFLDDPGQPVLSVIAPKEEEVTEEGIEAAMAEGAEEPELIRKREGEEETE